MAKQFPFGFDLSGMNKYSLCSENDENDQPVVQNHGCSVNHNTVGDLCNLLNNHKVETYLSRIDELPKSSGNQAPSFLKTCPPPKGSWFAQCIKDKCTGSNWDDKMCALGEENLRASLTLQDKQMWAFNEVKIDKFTSEVNKPAFEQFDLVDKNSLSVNYGFENKNLCNKESMSDSDGGVSKEKFCVPLSENMFFVLRTRDQADSSLSQLQIDFYQNVITSAVTSNDKKESLKQLNLKNPPDFENISLVMNIATLHPEELAVIVSVWPKSKPLLRVDYKLQISNIVCQVLNSVAQACITYEASTNEASGDGIKDLYSLNFLLYMKSDLAYKIPLATIDARGSDGGGSSSGKIMLTSAAEVSIEKQFGSIEDPILI